MHATLLSSPLLSRHGSYIWEKDSHTDCPSDYSSIPNIQPLQQPSPFPKIHHQPSTFTSLYLSLPTVVGYDSELHYDVTHITDAMSEPTNKASHMPLDTPVQYNEIQHNSLECSVSGDIFRNVLIQLYGHFWGFQVLPQSWVSFRRFQYQFFDFSKKITHNPYIKQH